MSGQNFDEASVLVLSENEEYPFVPLKERQKKFVSLEEAERQHRSVTRDAVTPKGNPKEAHFRHAVWSSDGKHLIGLVGEWHPIWGMMGKSWKFGR